MADAKAQLHGIVEELHRISNDMQPAALNELGLEAALQNLCRDVSQQSGLEVEFDTGGVEAPGDKIAVYLYRICQEALLNAIKHAHATRVSVQVLETRDTIVMIVEDNGRGFDIANHSGGNGLSNMRDRASLLGGAVSIESSAGYGATIRVKIPKDQ
jgi:signal transduction histidine kinase